MDFDFIVSIDSLRFSALRILVRTASLIGSVSISDVFVMMEFSFLACLFAEKRQQKQQRNLIGRRL